MRDSSWSDHEVVRYKVWVRASTDTEDDGSQKRRSKLMHHPHFQSTPSLSLSSPKLQHLDISDIYNLQSTIPECPGGFPHDPPESSFKISTVKDVGGCQPKMRETSSTERKRKKQHRNSDLLPKLELEDGLSAQILEGTVVSPSNIEHEGIATSCKRVKLSTQQIRKFSHEDVFETQPESEDTAKRSVDELGDLSNQFTLDSDYEQRSLDGETREQQAITRNKKVPGPKTSRSSFMARYRGPANNFPDYGEALIQTAVAITPGRNKAMAGEKKASIAGAFKPVNNLNKGGNTSSALSRPAQKKAFDLHENNYRRALDEAPVAKRRKIGTEYLVRRESSSSFIDMSEDSNQLGLDNKASSSSSTPNKTVQSISSRSHYPDQQFHHRFGMVDEFNKTELVVGFMSDRRRKSLLSELPRRNPLRREFEDDLRQKRIFLLPEAPNLVNKRTSSTDENSSDKDPIVVKDYDMDDLVELSRAPKEPQGRTRRAIRLSAPDRDFENAENPQNFLKLQKPREANGFLQTAASDSSGSIVEHPNEDEGVLPGNSQSFHDAVDEIQYVGKDDMARAENDNDRAKVDRKNHSKSGITYNIMKRYASPKSKSISGEGDIPKSTFSTTSAKSGHTRRMFKSELIFEVTYMYSGVRGFKVQDDCVAWKIQYNHENREFDIIANGDSVNDTFPFLVLKPGKIHSIKYHNDDVKVVIGRALEPSIGAAAQFLLKMANRGDGVRLAQSLKKLHQNITLLPVSSEMLDKIFNTAIKSNSSIQNHAQDISLLTSKEARLARAQERTWNHNTGSEKVENDESNRLANVGRRSGSTTDRNPPASALKHSVIDRMLPNSSSNTPASPRVPKVILPARIEVLSPRRHSSPNRDDFRSSRPTTRASSGQWTNDRLFRPLKSRSPSPARWTAEHPNWQKERSWQASLIFPREGKNRATVDATDIERLDEGGFLNDNLIAFYLRFLGDSLEKSRPELAKRIYFHNTFFYEALTQGKVRSNNINYDAVKRWTSKVDLFSYDYIVVPVCEKLHWYVAIICNAPRLLQPDTPEVMKFQTDGEHNIPSLKDVQNPILQESNRDFGGTKRLDTFSEPARHRSASPSVIAQVEQMSLDDQEQEWPEPDTTPETPQARIATPRSLPTNDIQSDDPAGGYEVPNQGQGQHVRSKGKKMKRKSIPPSRKYNPSDPRIITLDSLGQAHSPTCTNLKEYLICEAKERHNIDIEPGRSGMTAKGLPQQSNYCDCGIFVLGYIEKFLESPDEFIQNILQGDVAESRASVKIEASKMRAEIRELIFHLQAEQNQDVKSRREPRSKVKAAEAESRPMESDKISTNKDQLVNNRSLKIVDVKAESDSSVSSESAMQSFTNSLTSNARDSMITKRMATRRRSSTVNGHDSFHLAATEAHSVEIPKTDKSKYFSVNAAPPRIETEDSEIMETPANSSEEELILLTKTPISPKRKSLCCSDSTDTSIQLESPLQLASSDHGRETTSDRKREAGWKTQNTFKSFARSSHSPFQYTRYNDRREEISEHDPVEINDSPEIHRVEVRETPHRQGEWDTSFEDILEPSTTPQISKPFVLLDDNSPELEIVSPSKALRRQRITQQ